MNQRYIRNRWTVKKPNLGLLDEDNEDVVEELIERVLEQADAVFTADDVVTERTDDGHEARISGEAQRRQRREVVLDE